MERNYNFIYEKLVKSEDDLVGLIAYAIYKKHKIEFITRIKEEEGREPSQEECTAFFKASTTDSQLTKYINDATSILSDVVANTTNEELERYEREMLADYEERIKKCLPPWWHNVIWSVIASFIFSGMGIFFYYLGVTEKQSTPQQIEIKITSNDSIPAPTIQASPVQP
jgi:hypothetical protein